MLKTWIRNTGAFTRIRSNEEGPGNFRRLQEAHPDARCELDHETPFQLLISTVLSAQATDVQVNKVTKDLYLELPDCAAWLNLEIPEIEERIKSIGLYKSKAKNIHRLVRQIMEDHQGEVPDTMEELTALSGVGRKTASVVLANAFNIPAFAVDTHVFRLANRIGITDERMREKRNRPTKRWTGICGSSATTC